jgi:hypothetical protein
MSLQLLHSCVDSIDSFQQCSVTHVGGVSPGETSLSTFGFSGWLCRPGGPAGLALVTWSQASAEVKLIQVAQVNKAGIHGKPQG